MFPGSYIIKFNFSRVHFTSSQVNRIARARITVAVKDDNINRRLLNREVLSARGENWLLNYNNYNYMETQFATVAD